MQQNTYYKSNKNIVDNIYRIFKSKVNMTHAEMLKWKKNKCSRVASIKIDEVIDRVTRLLRKPKTTWNATDVTDSKKVISYISRAKEIKDSLKPAKRKLGCMKGKNFYALRNWAYDREKEVRKNPVPFSLENFRRWMQIYMLKNKTMLLNNMKKKTFYDTKIYEDIQKYFNVYYSNRIEIPQSWRHGEAKNLDGTARFINIYPWRGDITIEFSALVMRFTYIFKIIFNADLPEFKKILYWKFFTSSYYNLFTLYVAIDPFVKVNIEKTLNKKFNELV